MGTEDESDPTHLGWMCGFPPAPDKIIRYADGSFYQWPQLRWSFNNMEQLVPTKPVWRGHSNSIALSRNPGRFRDLIIPTAQGDLDWQTMLAATTTDGLLVLHRGEVVYEEYFGACGPHVRHLMQSCNKSFVGTIAECLIHDGLLDEGALVPEIVPELSGSAWADATVRQVMDMLIGLEFHEDYLDPASDIWRFLRATGMAPPGETDKFETIAEVLPGFRKQGQHGTAFAYREPNIFVLGWIVRRIGGLSLADQLSTRIWQHLGADRDAYYLVDGSGAETTAGATLPDFVRFGEMIRNSGTVGSKQIIAAEVVDKIFLGGDPALFAKAGLTTLNGWSYRSQWWIRHLNGRKIAVARGAHGQLLYIDPLNELVIGRYGSARKPPSSLLDGVLLPLVDVITAHLAD